MLKAFLLSAGLGTRLRPLTDEMPKCLLPICGQPLLEIWLELLGLDGVSEVLVNTHWHYEKVEAFVKQRVNSYLLLVNGERDAGMDGWLDDRMNSFGIRDGRMNRTEVREQRSEVSERIKMKE
jgi:NDP-sugar pyrophosphorylase family protein